MSTTQTAALLTLTRIRCIKSSTTHALMNATADFAYGAVVSGLGNPIGEAAPVRRFVDTV